jgi:hypothetical protein
MIMPSKNFKISDDYENNISEEKNFKFSKNLNEKISFGKQNYFEVIILVA